MMLGNYNLKQINHIAYKTICWDMTVQHKILYQVFSLGTIISRRTFIIALLDTVK